MADPLRQSTIYSYLRCPYQHFLRTTDPTSQSYRNPAAVFGTVIHGLIARMHAGEWEMDIETEFLKAFEWEATERQNDSPTLPIRWKDETKEREQHLQDAVAMLDGYRSKDYNRNAKILLAEATFTVKLGRQTLTGTIDQLRQHPDGALELVDFKTSKAAPPQAYVDLDYQLALYAWALKHGTFLVGGRLVQPNVLPDLLTLYFLRHHIPYKRATNGKAAGEERGDPRITTTRSAEQLKAMKTDVASVARMIRAGLFPRSPDPMKCSCCAYTDACRGAALDASLSVRRIEELVTQLENVA
jgi:RecB family exonuclease